MAVSMTVSETLDGTQVADALATSGAQATGVDMGSGVNSGYTPVTVKADNTGRKDLFVRHNSVIDPITSVGIYIQQYGVGTSFSYGGADSAVNDFAKLKSLANASGSSKNNADGLSGGLWLDMNATLVDVQASTQFDFATNGIGNGGNDTVAIFGDNNTEGIDLASAFVINSKAMVIDTDQSQGGDGTNGFVPTAPVSGQIGKDGDTVLGDNAHLKFRFYIRNDTTDGGIVQWETVIKYSFTA